MENNQNWRDEAIAAAVHRIERKYSDEPLLGELCGVAALYTLAKNLDKANEVTNLRGLLEACGVGRDAIDVIVSAVGGHWSEYYELTGKFSEADLLGLFERKYISLLSLRFRRADCLDAFSLKLMDIRRGESCLDLCSGIGFFMADAWRMMDKMGGATGIELAGVEYDKSLAAYAAVLAHVRGTGGKVHVESCFDPRHIRVKYDKVHCDAPFGVRVQELQFMQLQHTLLAAFPDFPVVSLTRADWYFAARAVAALKPGGRAVVLMPRAALDNEQGRSYRRYFLAKNLVESVTAFPPDAYPGVRIAVAVVVFAANSSCVKLYDVADSPAVKIDGTSFDYNRVAEELKGNGGNVLTKDVGEILSNGADLEPDAYLVESTRGRETRPLGSLVCGGRRGVSLTQEELAALRPHEGESPVAHYLTTANLVDGQISGDMAPLRKTPPGALLTERGDLVLSRSGSSCKVSVVTGTGLFVVDGNLIVLMGPKINANCLLAFFASAEGEKQLRRVSSGLQQTISLKKLMKIPVPVMDREKADDLMLTVSARLMKMQELRTQIESYRQSMKDVFEQFLT